MKSFNGKLLLFGEYGLLYGADALAVPFPSFKGIFKFSKEKTNSIITSQNEIKKFIAHLNQHNLNQKMHYKIRAEELENDLSEGLYFDSNIPLQYGVGSSGALCAAIFDRYSIFQKSETNLNDNILLQNLKQDFSLLESIFHGRSSGIDPLVSFINRPVLFSPGKIELPGIKIRTNDFSVFLIDTKIKSSTAPLVELFRRKMQDADFETTFNENFLPANNAAIRNFLRGNTSDLFRNLEQISQFQSEHFTEMIPENFRDFFKNNTKKGNPVKLLGSGGGGFLLAFEKNENNLPKHLIKLKVF